MTAVRSTTSSRADRSRRVPNMPVMLLIFRLGVKELDRTPAF
jgi:hypothetical protein